MGRFLFIFMTKVLEGKRIAFLGRLSSMSRKDAAELVRARGALVSEKPSAQVDWIVLGEENTIEDFLQSESQTAETLRKLLDAQSVEIVGETRLWQELGLLGEPVSLDRLYTPAMLAELLGVSVAVIRRWRRRGLIVPVREVRRLPYFDYHEVANAKQLAKLLASGMSPEAIERRLASLAEYVPSADRSLAQLGIMIEGKDVLLRQGDGLIDSGGQLRFAFSEDDRGAPSAEPVDSPEPLPITDELAPHAMPMPTKPEEIAEMADALEEAGELVGAAEMLRALMAAEGPSAGRCFQLAELLYRLGDYPAARERYYMAIELDEDLVEARANLGVVLAQTGQDDLAEAAFLGALRYHPDYADVHCHLARLLEKADRHEEAKPHWEALLRHAPESVWAEEARERLDETSID